MKRLLLPFTCDVEMDILEALVLLAANQRATLIPLSLIALPTIRRKGTRLELIQQSKDFLEAVRYKAARLHVPIEPREVFTRDAETSILQAIAELHCDGILLASRGKRGSLLGLETIERLLAVKPCSLYLTHFAPSTSEIWSLRVRAYFDSWRSKGHSLPTDTQLIMQQAPTPAALEQSKRQEEPELTAGVR